MNFKNILKSFIYKICPRCKGQIVTALIEADDLFVGVEYINEYRKISWMSEHLYGGLTLGFGKNVFVFDINSCDFFKGGKK